MSRRFQFSLKTLLLAACVLPVIVGIAIPTANLAPVVWREQRELFFGDHYKGPPYTEAEIRSMEWKRERKRAVALFIVYLMVCLAVLAVLVANLRRLLIRRKARE